MTKEDLQAISDLLDSKLDSKLEPIKTDISELKQRMEKVEQRTTKLELSYEHNTGKILSLLQEAYLPLVEKAKETGDYSTTKDMVQNHEQALTNHNQRITKLEKTV